jgi:alkanesulfonate monooxygenase SsuD/methylene tetrahydromethanopterin reductase-like flavin-dependent oxidoreductase (luciferase family)
VRLYKEALEEAGQPKPKEMVLVREYFCANSRDEALRKAEWGFKKKYEVYAKHGLHGADEELTRKVAGGDLEVLMQDTFIVGSPTEVVEDIAKYRALGFTQIALRLFYPGMSQKETLEHIEITGSNVVPAVHKL